MSLSCSALHCVAGADRVARPARRARGCRVTEDPTTRRAPDIRREGRQKPRAATTAARAFRRDPAGVEKRRGRGRAESASSSGCRGRRWVGGAVVGARRVGEVGGYAARRESIIITFRLDTFARGISEARATARRKTRLFARAHAHTAGAKTPHVPKVDTSCKRSAQGYAPHGSLLVATVSTATAQRAAGGAADTPRSRAQRARGLSRRRRRSQGAEGAAGGRFACYRFCIVSVSFWCRYSIVFFLFYARFRYVI